LRGRAGAKLAEFRPTKKKKKFQWGKIQSMNRSGAAFGAQK
jgi:hypothetical protein